ncbi:MULTISPECIES: TetR/AcrR family transcriptional regulator [Cryobacterium]|uniref:TetR/AcrR family transcriptional regulator n=1 Tax=Cryobacterium glucosi TaxID=1259175 RepID=A0ABY2IU91_9MICO|nr:MULTISPECIES: TetR/AcrR family transcriptional regulator [Cryobacterium]TFB99721.1 TetR/AcrR family transcriptional regulator [Cryobacterium sp. MDB2-A-1]TFC09704.1 TetR/AcrR family transcriptional regulator [Cryobacterium sp. MDB2-A-2]TFC22670.1 TetR/AcrR family transcriptional regulator [Cryobacterium glucosi]TFC23964.1 TetR/AcrR family transcriptional regulator [Cryobacterium sp. MDB2-10]
MRDRILAAAAIDFADRGYAGTSIGLIAERAATGKGQVQYHFSAKSDIALELVRSSFSRAPFANVIDDGPTVRGMEAIVASIRGVAGAFRDDVSVRAAVRLVREYHLIPVALPTPYLGWVARIGMLLREAEAAGEIPTGLDHDLEAWHLVAYFSGVQEVSNRLTDRDDLPERIEEMLARALPALGVVHPERFL